MATRAPLALAVTLALASTSACAAAADRLPDGDPDVTGVVAAPASGSPMLAEPSSDYYDGMSLAIGDPLIVRDDDADSPARLEDGDAVEVWIGEVCAESFPVQCEIVAVRVTG